MYNNNILPDVRLQLIARWSDWFYDHTNTFSGALGTQLAYLWPAIVKGNQIEVSENSAIVKLLKDNNIAPNEDIWNYIDIRN